MPGYSFSAIVQVKGSGIEKLNGCAREEELRPFLETLQSLSVKCSNKITPPHLPRCESAGKILCPKIKPQCSQFKQKCLWLLACRDDCTDCHLAVLE
jgi:hypothetical protein